MLAPPQARAILLGASNLALALDAAIEAAREILGGPIEILAAIGLGRSYGRPSRVLGRELPGILECGIWDALASRPSLPRYHLLADIGNDIGYGVEPETLVRWVAECLERLEQPGARTAIVLPPVASLEGSPRWRFAAARTILFPSCRLGKEETLRRLAEVAAALRDLGAAAGAAVVDPPREWYGLDPIHIRRAAREEAWRRSLESWGGGLGRGGQAPFRAERFLGLSLRAERYRVFGRERRRTQPVATFPDGTEISLY